VYFIIEKESFPRERFFERSLDFFTDKVALRKQFAHSIKKAYVDDFIESIEFIEEWVQTIYSLLSV
jgi:hypothetical protein